MSILVLLTFETTRLLIMGHFIYTYFSIAHQYNVHSEIIKTEFRYTITEAKPSISVFIYMNNM